MGRHPLTTLPRLRGQQGPDGYARRVEILWWLAPAVVVTVLAMAWVGWTGRDGRGEVDRDVAVARLAAAMERDHPRVRRTDPASRGDRSTGIAVRPSRASGGEGEGLAR